MVEKRNILLEIEGRSDNDLRTLIQYISKYNPIYIN